MSARARFALLLACSLGACSSPALAAAEAQPQNPLNDQGSSPNYRSTITSITPAAPGLQLQVLQFSDRLLLRNGTGKTVEIRGYEGERYARVQPNGTVEVNTHAPAYYLNQSFYGNVTVPSFASANAVPHWLLIDRTGQFEWHDHRIHWMSPVPPPQVKDKGRRTLIFDWRVPIAVGSRSGDVAGTLYWTPNASSAPVAMIVIGGAIVVLGLLLVPVVRRRRARGDSALGGGGGPAGDGSPRAPRAGSREAW
ncbi:MAG TPA: hypothetical protein VK707_06410 [Solirubrobacteraceae bacterium]|jgi:hypothetical protein|nr:hypothetical protein [Solirubrobacteraceae bacterium]